MQIEKLISDNLTTLQIKGEVDASSSIALDDTLKGAVEGESFRILVDCKDLDYISSAGLGVFISYLEDINNRNGKLAFVDMNENVYEVFRILGLHELLHIYETHDQAKAYLTGEA